MSPSFLVGHQLWTLGTLIEQRYHDSLGQDNSILCIFVSEATTWLSQGSGLLVGRKMLEGLVCKSLDYGRTRFTNSGQTCICRTHNLIEYAWMCVSIFFYRKKKPLEISDNFPFTSDCVSYGHGGILSGALWFWYIQMFHIKMTSFPMRGF